nr:PRC-barrel domain-containing protein [Mesorhizobium sp.]
MTTQTGHTQAIAASRVIGTSVYNTEGTSIGSIEDVMLDKMTNGIHVRGDRFWRLPRHWRKISRHSVGKPRL